MYNNTYERPRTQIEKCEHLARMKFENPIEKAQRERDERVYRFSSVDEAIGVLSALKAVCGALPHTPPKALPLESAKGLTTL